MKISKSKQELARIISENGGWRDSAEFAWYGNQTKKGWFGISKPRYSPKQKSLQILRSHLAGSFPCRKPKNWHQTILSRAEYFHLYPAPDAKPQFCESVMRSIPEYEIHSKNIDIAQVDDIGVVESKPTIEQLAADYRNASDYADRKQKEADDAKADADAKLKALELAGESLGLLVSPIADKQGPELVSEVKVGDEVECVESNIKRDKYNGMVGRLHFIDESDTSTPYLVDFGGNEKIWCHEVKFIRRP